jgi:hypothetical protein
MDGKGSKEEPTGSAGTYTYSHAHTETALRGKERVLTANIVIDFEGPCTVYAPVERASA